MPELTYTDDNDALFHHVGRGEYFQPGATISVDSEEVGALLDHPVADFERAGGDSDTETDSADDSEISEESVDAPFDPDEYSVSELQDELESRDLSGDELDALEAAERSRDNGPRSTALSAIESARE